jgi:hypothetical protein
MHATVNTSSKAKVEGECGSVMLCRQGAGAAILFFFVIRACDEGGLCLRGVDVIQEDVCRVATAEEEPM